MQTENMVGTRSSTKKAGNANRSPNHAEKAAAGSKRKTADTTSPDSNRERKLAKKQTTIEAAFGKDKDRETYTDSKVENAPDESKQSKKDEKGTDKSDEDPRTEDDSPSAAAKSKDNKTVRKSSEREERLPSSILEKGIIYFFTRNRVGIDDAESVGDLARTYFVLRPLPTSAKLQDGALPDLKNNRLLVLPKKSFPKSHRDRFMASLPGPRWASMQSF